MPSMRGTRGSPRFAKYVIMVERYVDMSGLSPRHLGTCNSKAGKLDAVYPSTIFVERHVSKGWMRSSVMPVIQLVVSMIGRFGYFLAFGGRVVGWSIHPVLTATLLQVESIQMFF